MTIEETCTIHGKTEFLCVKCAKHAALAKGRDDLKTKLDALKEISLKEKWVVVPSIEGRQSFPFYKVMEELNKR